MKTARLNSLVLGTVLALAATSASAQQVAGAKVGGIAAAVAIALGQQFSVLSPNVQSAILEARTIDGAVEVLKGAGINNIDSAAVYEAQQSASLNLAAAQIEVGAPASVNYAGDSFALSNFVANGADCSLKSIAQRPASSVATRQVSLLQNKAASLAGSASGLLLSPNFLSESVGLLNPAGGEEVQAVAMGYAALLPALEEQVNVALSDNVVQPAEANCLVYQAAGQAALNNGHDLESAKNLGDGIATHCNFSAGNYVTGSCSLKAKS